MAAAAFSRRDVSGSRYTTHARLPRLEGMVFAAGFGSVAACRAWGPPATGVPPPALFPSPPPPDPSPTQPDPTRADRPSTPNADEAGIASRATYPQTNPHG